PVLVVLQAPLRAAGRRQQLAAGIESHRLCSRCRSVAGLEGDPGHKHLAGANAEQCASVPEAEVAGLAKATRVRSVDNLRWDERPKRPRADGRWSTRWPRSARCSCRPPGDSHVDVGDATTTAHADPLERVIEAIEP